MNVDKNRGFTLIEMMVVIAVVGILSAAVLAGLSPARNKAKDSRIISGVQQARSIVETLYDPVSGLYPAGEPADTSYGAVKADVAKAGGTLTYTTDSGNSFTISSVLKSDGTKYYCVDSSGTVQIGTSPGAGTGACPGGGAPAAPPAGGPPAI